jgi:hypothetical protein
MESRSAPCWRKTLRGGAVLRMGAEDQWNEAGLSAGNATFRPFPEMLPAAGGVRLNPRAAGPVLRCGQIVTLLCQLAAPITLDYTAQPFASAYNRVASGAVVRLQN